MTKFQEEGFTVEATHNPGCKLHCLVTLDEKQSASCHKKAIKKVNKQISIPGFRKGKAPDATVLSRYSTYVEQEWKDLLIHEALNAALRLTKIFPMKKESIDKPEIKECSLEKGATVEVSYEHYPEVPEIDFSQLKLEEIPLEPVDTKRVDEIIEEIARGHADFEPIEGRAVKSGDFVDLTIHSLDEEEPKELAREQRFEIDKKRMAPWLEKLLVGMNVGDVQDATTEIDPEADDEAKAKFKPSQVRVEVVAIKKSVPPKLDDEFAKKLDLDSYEALVNNITTNLQKEKEEELKKTQIKSLEKALLEAYTFELPLSVAEAERRVRIKERIEKLQSEKASEEEIKKQEKNIEKEVAAEVDVALRLYFLNKQIARQGNISLSNQELNDEIVRTIGSNPLLHGKELDKEFSQRLASQIAGNLMHKKTNEYALSQIVVQKT